MPNEEYIIKQSYKELPPSGDELCLSLYLTPHSFTYAIFNSHYSKVYELCEVEITAYGKQSQSLTEKIFFLIHNHLLHQKKFEKTNICILNSDFTLVPESFSSGEFKHLLQFTTGNQTIKISREHKIKDLKFCFSANQDLISDLERFFPNASIRHSGAVAIDLFFSQHSLIKSNLFLSISNGMIELVGKENNQVLFYNVFKYDNNEDVLYYLLFMMEQFQLNPLEVKLSIAGNRDLNDELIKSIKKYIKQVYFAVHEPTVLLSNELNDLPKQYNFTLLNQHVCAL